MRDHYLDLRIIVENHRLKNQFFDEKDSFSFPLHGQCPNAEIFLDRIQSKNWKIRTRKNSVFGHFPRSVSILNSIVLEYMKLSAGNIN